MHGSKKPKKQLRKEAKTKRQNIELENLANYPDNQDQLVLFLGEYFLNMIDELPHALYFINANDLVVTFASQKSSHKKLSKKNLCFNLIYNEKKPCSGTDHPCILEAVKETKKLVMVEHVHNEKGQRRYYRVFGYPILDNDGNVTHVIEYPLEITEQKHAEKKAEINLAKYKNIFNATTDGLVVIDFEDNIKDANPQLCEMFGYTYAEILQLKGKELTPPEYHHSFKNIKSDIQTRGEFFTESVGKRKDGSTFHLEVKGTTFIDKDTTQMLGIMRDITERKKFEKALQNHEEDLLKKTQNIEEANAALKVLLKSIEEERKELEKKVIGNFKEMIFPYIETLMETKLNPKQQVCLKIIESNLKKIASPFLDKLKFYGLSPAEIKVLNFIKEGKRTKEIADIMGLSKRTIDSYRYNIRKKLKISNNLPLTTYLLDIN